jgi:hypothetical protein
LRYYNEATCVAGQYPGLKGRALMNLLFAPTIP